MPEPGRPMGPIGVRPAPEGPEMRSPGRGPITPPTELAGGLVRDAAVTIGAGKYMWSTAYQGPGRTLTCVYSHDATDLVNRMYDKVKEKDIAKALVGMTAVRIELLYNLAAPGSTRKQPVFKTFALRLDFAVPEKLNVFDNEELRVRLHDYLEEPTKVVTSAGRSIKVVREQLTPTQRRISLIVEDIPIDKFSFIESHVPTYVEAVAGVLQELLKVPEVADPLYAVIRDSAKKGIAEVESSRTKV